MFARIRSLRSICFFAVNFAISGLQMNFGEFLSSNHEQGKTKDLKIVLRTLLEDFLNSFAVAQQMTILNKNYLYVKDIIMILR
jgi:hypothetical protein